MRYSRRGRAGRRYGRRSYGRRSYSRRRGSVGRRRRITRRIGFRM